MADRIKIIKDKLNNKDFQKSLYAKTMSKEYVVLLILQFDKITENYQSVKCLLDKGYVEDAYAIFRKMLETFFLLHCVLANPKVAKRYMVHNEMVVKRVSNKKRIGEIKEFTDGKPDGYLEYGFIESLVDTSEEGFKYTIRTVAKAGEIEELYNWYRVTSNFVHNNLTRFKINKENLTQKMNQMCEQLFERLELILSRY